jgi:hypothetical protein
VELLTVSGNHSSGSGGGLSLGGTVTVSNSTISGNTAAYFGAGINNDAVLAVTNCTISGNSTPTGLGGGIANEGYPAIGQGGTLTLTSSTVSGNTARQGGGVDNVELPAVTYSRNTIIAGNTASSSSPDVAGALTSQGHNLIGDGSGASGVTATDLVGTAAHPIDPMLGPLQDNGGPTQTMALLPGSPAIDAGDNAFAPGPYDQRGPGFARIVGGTIDIGAFEVQTVQVVTVQPGQTEEAAFWHSSDGQALIRSFNGGPQSTALANWLAASFPNLAGPNSGGHDLTGLTNVQVAELFQALYARRQDNLTVRLAVELLTTALNVYATTQSLGGTQGQAYGFLVTSAGLGQSSFNVGHDGAAFGVADNTTLTVNQLLQAVDARAVDGQPYHGDHHLEGLAADLFARLNVAGD